MRTAGREPWAMRVARASDEWQGRVGGLWRRGGDGGRARGSGMAEEAAVVVAAAVAVAVVVVVVACRYMGGHMGLG